MATIKGVAREAGVSVGTVSNYLTDPDSLSDARRERVARAVEKLRYEPNPAARSLRSKQTRIIGMVIPDITNPFFPQLVRGAEECAARSGYILTTFNTDDRLDREASAIASCRSHGVDGLLLVVAPGKGNTAQIKATRQAGMPLVCLDRTPVGLHVDCVLSDNREGSRQCMYHLLSLGHRLIAFIGGPRSLCNAEDRLAGYREALAHAGVREDKSLVLDEDFRVEGGLRAGRKLLARARKPTAVFIANGMMALGMLQALGEAGLHCPEDTSVACFDELTVAEVFRPRLTTVVQPAYGIGQRGMELLLDRINGAIKEDKPVRILLETELRVRESTIRPMR
jgi:LacI family transcriptional regulator